MIPGFNLDIKHKGKTFHIQTEDSGPANPVIMTHLFLFGTILGTRRLEYADAVARPDVADHVRELMRGELRGMHKALLAGEFDELARRPQKKTGGDSAVRRTGEGGPTLPPAGASPVLVSRPPGAAPVAFADERTDLVTLPSDGLPQRSIDTMGNMATLDAEDLLDASDIVESVDGEVEGEADGELASLSPGDLLDVLDDVVVVPARPQTAPIDRSTFPAMLPRSATPVRAPRGGVEFPTDLVAETRFDDVILAWLLEDVDEP